MCVCVCVFLDLLYNYCAALIHHLVGANEIKYVLVISLSYVCAHVFGQLLLKEHHLDHLASSSACICVCYHLFHVCSKIVNVYLYRYTIFDQRRVGIIDEVYYGVHDRLHIYLTPCVVFFFFPWH